MLRARSARASGIAIIRIAEALMLDAVGGVLGFLLAHVLAGVLAALLPSWRASKADTSATLGPPPLKTAGTRPPFG